MSRPGVRLFYAAAQTFGVTSWVSKKWTSQRVVSYHNVLPDEWMSLAPADGNVVSCSTLHRQLAEIGRHLPFTTEIGRPQSVLVTFDDGNRNNFECALPVLEELGIKAYFFVPLDTPRTGISAWVDVVRLWCDWADAGAVFPGPVDGRLGGGIQARHLARSKLMDAVFKQPEIRSEIRRDIADWKARQTNVPPQYLSFRYEPMTEDHLQRLKDLGHRVGSHSLRHDRLSTLSPDTLKEDFRRTAAEVGRMYNTDAYCYPFGGAEEVNDRVVSACSEAGFRCAFINCESVGFDGGNYTLPRFTLEDDDDPLIVRTRISGLDFWLKRMLRR